MATAFYIHEDQENLPLKVVKAAMKSTVGNGKDDFSEKIVHTHRETLSQINNKLNGGFLIPPPKKHDGQNRKPLSVVSTSTSASTDNNVLQAQTFNAKPTNFKFYSTPEEQSIDEYKDDIHQRSEVENMSISSCASEHDKSIQDHVDSDDFALVHITPEYREDIRKYLLESEKRHRPHPRYMSRQPELTDQMRAILVDWLVSVSDEYQMSSDTLHIAVSYVDRFLSKMSVVRTKLQLVGVTSMMIAAKYEEIYPPDLAEFVFLTSETYTSRQLIRMEQLILRVLSFDLVSPTVHSFIDEYIVGIGDNELVYKMATYLSELCLVESTSLLQFLPSEIAAGCVALARHNLNRDNIWPNSLELLSGCSLKQMTPLVKTQQKIFEESPAKALQAVNTKYRTERHKQIAKIKPRLLLLEE